MLLACALVFPIRFSGFPIIAHTPETSLMLGGGLVYHFDSGEEGDDARRSNLGGTLVFTLKGQFIVGVGPTLYLQGETWRITGGASAALFPNTLYAAGADSPADSAEEFTERQVGGEVAVTRLLVGALRAGAGLAIGHSSITETEAGGLLESGELGADGGLIVGIGPQLVWDDRDNDFSPERGGRYGATAVWYPDAVGDYGFTHVTVQAAHYRAIVPGHVVAAEVFGEFTAGDVPFQAMPGLGGQNRMRGFFQGRFRDSHMVAAQVEYRTHLAWKIGGVVFGGAGDVAHTIDGFELDSLEYAGGAGLRYALNEADRVNIRLDVGYNSEGDTNLYISLGEAF
jgi:outer membrane protein assembly factor BamA